MESNFCGCAKSKRTHAGDSGKPAAALDGAGRCVVCHIVCAEPLLSWTPPCIPAPSTRCRTACGDPNSLEAVTVITFAVTSSSTHPAEAGVDAVIATSRISQHNMTTAAFIVFRFCVNRVSITTRFSPKDVLQLQHLCRAAKLS